MGLREVQRPVVWHAKKEIQPSVEDGYGVDHSTKLDYSKLQIRMRLIEIENLIFMVRKCSFKCWTKGIWIVDLRRLKQQLYQLSQHKRPVYQKSFSS